MSTEVTNVGIWTLNASKSKPLNLVTKAATGTYDANNFACTPENPTPLMVGTEYYISYVEKGNDGNLKAKCTFVGPSGIPSNFKR
jgi:hypothetical protein